MSETLTDQDLPVARAPASSPAPAEKSRLLDHAYHDYCQLLKGGVEVSVDEYCDRFPAFKTALRHVIDLDDLVNGHISLVGGEKPSDDTAWPREGELFQGLFLRHLLGRGAFGRVFLATEAALGNRQVAVKVSRGGGGEARTLGRLTHDNIVPVLTVKEDRESKLTAVVMRYLGSATLLDVLNVIAAGGGPPARGDAVVAAIRSRATVEDPPAEPRLLPAALRKGSYVEAIVHLGAQLADALAYIHEEGIVHRDLKPSNVLLTPGGRPMLLDFNLASDPAAARLRVGGTMPYMSPEQLRAAFPDKAAAARPAAPPPPPVTGPSDVFALGVILYELLAGRHPFGPCPRNATDGELFDLLLRRHEEGPRPLCLANPQAGARLGRLIERCLEPDPAKRPTAVELARELRRSQRTVGRWLSRHGHKVAAVLLVGASLALYGAFTPEPEPYKQGMTEVRAGDWEEAARHFADAVRANPRSPEALYALAQARLRQGKYLDAAEHLAAADGLVVNGKVRASRGYCMTRLRLHKDAIHHYKQAIAAGHKTAAVYNNLGYSCLMFARLDESQTALDRAIELDPRLQAAYFNRAFRDEIRARQDENYVPRQGIEDMRAAFNLGPGGYIEHRYAAFLHAVAMERCGDAVEAAGYRAGALAHIAEALQHGCPLQVLTCDPCLLRLTRQFPPDTIERLSNAKLEPARISRLATPPFDL